MTLTRRTSAPRGFYILNVLRVCSVISLISTIVAETTTQIKTYNGTMAFILVDMVGQNITSAGCIFLIMSECSLAPKYYSRHWPHFARDAPLTGQGMAEVFAGVLLLGNLNKSYVTKKVVGTPFGALLIASGVVVIASGVCTFIASFVFRDKKTTARMARSIRRYRQARQLDDAGLPEASISDPVHPDVSVPERSYSFGGINSPSISCGGGGRQEPANGSYYLRALPRLDSSGGGGGGINQAKSDCSSRYSVDAEQMAARYQDDLRPPV